MDVSILSLVELIDNMFNLEQKMPLEGGFSCLYRLKNPKEPFAKIDLRAFLVFPVELGVCGCKVDVFYIW